LNLRIKSPLLYQLS